MSDQRASAAAAGGRPRARRRAGWPVLVLAIVGLGGDEPRGSRPGREAAEPLRGSIHLRVDEPANPRRRNLRLDQPGALPLKARDQFRIEARLNRPAYLYV